jgi:integrase
MTADRGQPRTRRRGRVRRLPSGSLQVTVYAGEDPLTGKRIDLSETVPAGTNAAKEAEKVRVRLLNQVDEQRNPRTSATMSQLMDRYMEVIDVDRTTRKGYESRINSHIRPLLGHLPVARVNGEMLDSFFTVLRTCRTHCGGTRRTIDHRTDREHACDQRCRPHVCRPLSTSLIRQIHGCLSGALSRAVRWRWISVNPLDQAQRQKSVRYDPCPPTPEQAATIVSEAFADPDWGMFVWLAMTTGARRGELCAIRLNQIDLHSKVLSIRTSIAQDGAQTWEKDTKAHQQRRIALDATTVALLHTYLQRCETTVADLGISVAPDSWLFSSAPDHGSWLKPDTVSQRYERMCARLGWDMHIHQLRHYAATELIAAGVDVRTVAGRLGHGGGGAVTLRYYTAWVSEADQRAAGSLAGRMPVAPLDLDEVGQARRAAVVQTNAAAPYLRIAADLRGAIACQALNPGDPLPTLKDISARYSVSAGTAHRALEQLKSDGLVSASRGRRAVVSADAELALTGDVE